ncbi:biotin--[acetyl-CoA-carboxylase] ligase [Uliginosibacterium aquaticum]|uniref:Biotin--[acetyl-CoA-carboxylase] ligase n=1 Tax=Uliginosibacterium aquaticum TaxID=2731212 RepID=A0ABX2IQ42_9RHOO|nr:biotin--[acetyl-CoA-carboxylase] ligase [Uliginosibacterium aquaticum]NSL56265.1 biotin--[acetyl-CoA-carboxylase] ligase [Uliginosibacterium aquaticum]
MPAVFDYTALLVALGDQRARFDVDHIERCDSTNSVLLARASQGVPSGSVVVCDEQTAGRGRRGRSWRSGNASSSLTFSLLWRLAPGCSSAGLSLAVGLAVAQALESLNVPAVGLKWPNDIWLFGRKLGGVLIEVESDEAGLGLIIGIGLNLRRDAARDAGIDQAFASLDEALPELTREQVLGTILSQLALRLDHFARAGFAALRQDWAARNALYGLPVTVSSESGSHTGRCGHANAEGALELLTACGARVLITSGDLSLRLALAEDA